MKLKSEAKADEVPILITRCFHTKVPLYFFFERFVGIPRFLIVALLLSCGIGIAMDSNATKEDAETAAKQFLHSHTELRRELDRTRMALAEVAAENEQLREALQLKESEVMRVSRQLQERDVALDEELARLRLQVVSFATRALDDSRERSRLLTEVNRLQGVVVAMKRDPLTPSKNDPL